MLFQVLDDKKDCVSVCLDGKIIRDPSFENLTQTWRWTPSIGEDNEVECAFLYAGGKNLNDLCPEDLKEEWNTPFKKVRRIQHCLQRSQDRNTRCLS